MAQEQHKEVGRFMATGLVATTLDYTLLNLFVVVFGVPVLIANSISATVSSYVSYKFNKHIVFEDRMHGRRKTIVLYAAVIGFGILVIQNSIIHILSGGFSDQLAGIVKPVLDFVGLDEISEKTVAINVAKVIAGLAAAVWNYFMLRRFVFVSREEAES